MRPPHGGCCKSLAADPPRSIVRPRGGTMTARRFGLVAAVVACGLDQAVKAWLMFSFGIEARGSVELAPFLDLRLAWNTGISYSLFQADGDFGRFALVGLSLVASLLLGLWLWRARRRLTGLALGLIVGGALANAYDRFTYGAVVDFIHVHWGGFSPWGVFNLADVAIVVGVALLLYDAFLTRDVGSGAALPDDGA
jgi:signal peptidase II